MGAPKVYLINRPSSVQTTLYVGTQGLTRTNADYTSLAVANRVLGGVMGRLFRHLREEKGYTYGIGSNIQTSPFVGAWTASTSVRTEVTEPALRDLMAEIAEMRDKPVPAQELADSKRALVAQFALSLESPQQMLGYSLDRVGARAAVELLGHVSGADLRHHRRAGAGRGEEVLGSVASSDRRRRRRVEDSRHSRQVRHGRGLRRGGQAGRGAVIL